MPDSLLGSTYIIAHGLPLADGKPEINKLKNLIKVIGPEWTNQV